MASQNSSYSHITAFDCAELPYRFNGVFTAAWHKPALTAKEQSQARLIKPDCENNRFFDKTIYYVFFQKAAVPSQQVP
jgi:hypothetical protein